MLRRIITICLLLSINIVVMYGTYLNMTKNGAHAESMMSEVVPDFSWKDFDGKTHNIKELYGHTVVIHFWATWCGPCRKEFPELLKTAKLLGDDVIFLTISGDDYMEPTKKFISNNQKKAGAEQLSNVIYAFDPQKTISMDIFQTAVYPESIVLDKTQHMKRKFPGAIEWQNEDVINYLKQPK